MWKKEQRKKLPIYLSSLWKSNNEKDCQFIKAVCEMVSNIENDCKFIWAVCEKVTIKKIANLFKPFEISLHCIYCNSDETSYILQFPKHYIFNTNL